MKRTRIEFRRQLTKLDPRKKIGDTQDPEIMLPCYKKLYVYADTETFYITNGVKPWEHIGKKQISQVLAEMDVFPFILTGQYRRHKMSKHKNLYESGGVYSRNFYVDDLGVIEKLLIDLSFIRNEWGFTPVLCFHNSAYDIPVLEPFFRQLDPEMIIYFYTDDKRNFIRGAMRSEKYHFECEFGDTLKYDKSLSIEKAGRILGEEKIKGMPYALCDVQLDENNNIRYLDLYTGQERTFPLERYLEYAERDVDIARKLHERMVRQRDLVNSIMVEDGTRMKQYDFNKRCQTRPSHSKHICNKYLEMKGWKTIDEVFRFNLKDQPCPNYEELYQQVIESNCGGFTTVNKHIFRYDCDKDRIIRYFDRNSMYPTIMTQPLPFGQLLRKPYAPADSVVGYAIKLHSCKWKGSLTCLKNEAFGTKKCNGRKAFFVVKEYFDFVLENCEVEYEIVDTGYQAKTSVIKPLINMYYNKRKQCKERMETLERENLTHTKEYEDLNDQQGGLKLLMNSLYGKMCEKGHHTSRVYYESHYTKFKNEHLNYPCILTGSYITYTSRLELLKKIKGVLDRGWDFLYADTDSVVFGCPRDVTGVSLFGTDSGNLGEWKEEGVFDLFLNIGLKKKYILINRTTKKYKMALSGICGRVQDIIENKLKTRFEEAVEDLSYMFNPRNNLLIDRCKTTPVYNHSYNQLILYDTSFQMNSKVGKPTAIMRFHGDSYTIEKCREE